MPAIMRIKTYLASETTNLGYILGKEVVKYYPVGRGALVIALSGDLGTGKTIFTKGVGRGLGIKSTIHSPTFILMKRYPLTRSRFKNLWHIDCYRIRYAKELSGLGFQHIIRDPSNIVIIEWPECISRLIPKDAIIVSIAHAGGDARRLKFVS